MNGMVKPQGFGVMSMGSLEAPCALGGALQSINKQIVGNCHEANYDTCWITWPWLSKAGTCPACSYKWWASIETPTLLRVIYHLNDYHEWTRAAVAGWVATVEPAEEPKPKVVKELETCLM